MSLHNKTIGNLGEEKAVEYLRLKGYQILFKNYHTRWGEIDIIAKKNGKISFVEIKTRLNDLKGKPFEAVNYRKMKSLAKVIHYFIKQEHVQNYRFSMDVISILLTNQYAIDSISYFENVDMIEYVY